MITSLALGSDHGGLELKNFILAHLTKQYPALQVQDLGVYTPESVDYPDIAAKVAQSILNKETEVGILICGTGIGVSIKANRYIGIRAALVHDTFTATMAKQHNNANILCIGGRTSDPKDAANWVDLWLSVPFEGGRHSQRLEKLDIC